MQDIRTAKNYETNGVIHHQIGEKHYDACLADLWQPPEIIKKVHAWMKNPKGFFVFSGGFGIGKTYLISAMVNLWHAEGREIRYFTQQRLLTQLKSVIAQGHDSGAELERLCEVQYFFLDDFGATLQDTEFRADKMLQFIDERYNSNKPTVITTNLSEEEVEKIYSGRVASRMFSKENLVLCLSGEDHRRRSDKEVEENNSLSKKPLNVD